MAGILDLPRDIFMFEFFARMRLSLRRAIKQSLVCKGFKAIITSADFVQWHLRRNPKNNPCRYLLIYSWSRNRMLRINATRFVRRWEIRFPENIQNELGRDLAVYGSHNGLLCIANWVLHVDTPIYLWNPSIRKIRQLPRGLIDKNKSNDCDYRVTLGFGLDSAGGSGYKVIKFVQHAKTFQVEIYSLNANTWVRVRGLPRLPHGAQISPKCAYLDVVVYWAIHASNETKLFTISFDLRNEQFRVKRYPDLDPLMLPNCLQVWNNSLCFFQHGTKKEKKEYYWRILTLGMEPYTIETFEEFSIPGSLIIPWPLGFNMRGRGRRVDYAISNGHSSLVSWALDPFTDEIGLSLDEVTWYVDVYKESLALL